MTDRTPDRTVDSEDNIAPRHVFEASIRIRLERDQRKLSMLGFVRDLSESGLRAFVADGLVLGECVIFEIPLQESDKQVIPAKVVRALGTEYGFQFTALSSEQRCHIQTALKGRPTISRNEPGSTMSASMQ